MENLKEKLFSLATNDYQNRRGQYPASDVPDTINVFEHGNKIFVEFSFKNTSEFFADRWVCNYLKNKFDVYPFKVSTYQDGDYQNDWVVTQVQYLIEEEKVNEPVKVETEKGEEVCIGDGDSPYSAVKDVCNVLADIMDILEQKNNGI